MFRYIFSIITGLFSKVDHVVRLSTLIQDLQEERASVALNMFINKTSSLDTLDDLQKYVKVDGFDINQFSLKSVRVLFYDMSQY